MIPLMQLDSEGYLIQLDIKSIPMRDSGLSETIFQQVPWGLKNSVNTMRKCSRALIPQDLKERLFKPPGGSILHLRIQY